MLSVDRSCGSPSRRSIRRCPPVITPRSSVIVVYPFTPLRYGRRRPEPSPAQPREGPHASYGDLRVRVRIAPDRSSGGGPRRSAILVGSIHANGLGTGLSVPMWSERAVVGRGGRTQQGKSS